MADLRASTDVLDAGPPGGSSPRVMFLSAASGLARDRAWVWDLQSRYDLVHWHGDVEDLGVGCARRMAGALAEAGKPIVITVEAPRDGEPADVGGTDDDASPLDVLVAAAAAVIVRDEAYAAVVRDRWQREAVVIADPEGDDDACDEVYRSVVAGLS